MLGQFTTKMAFALAPTTAFTSKVASRVGASQQGTSARRSVVTMAKKKDVRLVITLECTEQRGEAAGVAPGVSRYTTTKVCAHFLPRPPRLCSGGIGPLETV